MPPPVMFLPLVMFPPVIFPLSVVFILTPVDSAAAVTQILHGVTLLSLEYEISSPSCVRSKVVDRLDLPCDIL